MSEQQGAFLTTLFIILSIAILVVPPYFMKEKTSKRFEQRVRK